MITNSEMIYTYIKTIEEENLKFKKNNEELLKQNQTLQDDLANLTKFSMFNNLNKQLKDKTNQVLTLEKTISKLRNNNEIKENKLVEQLEEKSVEKIEQIEEKSVEKIQQLEEKLIEQSEEKLIEQSEEKLIEQSVEQIIEQLEEKSEQILEKTDKPKKSKKNKSIEEIIETIEVVEKPKKIKKNKVLLELITWKSNTYFLNPITNEIFDVIDNKPSGHVGNLINNKVRLNI
jgi:hypothetical protein